MANEIVPVAFDLVPQQSKYGTVEAMEIVGKSGGWLPRVQLFQSSSKAVKERKIAMAHWGMVPEKNVVIDLGENVDILPLSWRPKALRMGAEGGAPISYYNPRSAEFQKVQAESDEKDSGCLFGSEFLIWVPSEKKYALLYLASKTARKKGKELLNLMLRGATLGSKYIAPEGSDYSWHGPTVTICSTPFEMPNREEAQQQIDLFNHPEESNVEFDPSEERVR